MIQFIHRKASPEVTVTPVQIPPISPHPSNIKKERKQSHGTRVRFNDDDEMDVPVEQAQSEHPTKVRNSILDFYNS